MNTMSSPCHPLLHKLNIYKRYAPDEDLVLTLSFHAFGEFQKEAQPFFKARSGYKTTTWTRA